MVLTGRSIRKVNTWDIWSQANEWCLSLYDIVTRFVIEYHHSSLNIGKFNVINHWVIFKRSISLEHQAIVLHLIDVQIPLVIYVNYPQYNISNPAMMRSSNGHIFRVTGHLCGEFPAQRPATRSFDVLFDLRLNKRLSKQSLGWWFETLPRPLWRHRNEIIFIPFYPIFLIHDLNERFYWRAMYFNSHEL